MKFETKRLILRPWTIDDADDLYNYAKDPLIGPSAGWPTHTSIENTREIIKNVLLKEGIFSVCLKENNKAIGSISLRSGESSNIDIAVDEAEIGYWIAVPFWGQGLIPEAVRELMNYGFNNLKIKRIWATYYDKNEKSLRVLEKCGFKYQYTIEDKYHSLIDRTLTQHIMNVDITQFKKQEQKI